MASPTLDISDVDRPAAKLTGLGNWETYSQWNVQLEAINIRTLRTMRSFDQLLYGLVPERSTKMSPPRVRPGQTV